VRQADCINPGDTVGKQADSTGGSRPSIVLSGSNGIENAGQTEELSPHFYPQAA